MKDGFLFTIVVAAYNADRYLDEAVQSLLKQDIGFEEHVQLILVNDGSTDSTRDICDSYARKWSENILVIHKKHEGVSSARNAALEHVRGRYVNFLDANDELSPVTLRTVLAFYEENEGRVSVVTIPRYLKGPKNKNYFLNFPSRRQERLVSLVKHPQFFCLDVDSSFFPAEVFDELRFNPHLDVREGAELVLRVLLEKPYLGIVQSGCGLFFRDSKQLSAALQPSRDRVGYYLPYQEHFVSAILEAAIKQCGYVPAYIQNALMFDLQWHFKLPMEVLEQNLSADQIARLHGMMRKNLAMFSDDVILSQRFLHPEMKARLLCIKKGTSITYEVKKKNPALCLSDGTVVSYVRTFPAKLEFMRFERKDLIIEGMIRLAKGSDVRRPDICLLVNGKEQYDGEWDDTHFSTSMVLGEPCSSMVWFKCVLPNAMDLGNYVVNVALKVSDKIIPLTNMQAGRFFPILRKVRRAYCLFGNCLATFADHGIKFMPYTVYKHVMHELAYLRKLVFGRFPGSRSAALTRIAYRFTKPFIPHDTWLISDRINKADDNGEALFRYIVGNNLHENTFYVIQKSAPDYNRMKEVGRVLKYLSFNHLLHHLNAEWVISSSSNRHVTLYPKERRSCYFQDILAKRKYVFLQHGITMNDVSNSIKRINTNMTMMVTSALREYHSIVDNPAYGYGSDVIKLTGFPRYDRRINEPEDIIYVAPSWRSWLASTFSGFYKTGTINVDVEQFRKSEYCRFFSALLKDHRMISAAKECGYRIVFVPHPSMASCSNLIEIDDYVEYASPDLTYNDVFRSGKLMVTDYSSVFMDFAYLKKPVLYVQFDKEEFFSHHYRAGYFSYENDGFGEVEYDLDSAVERIIEYIRSGCQLKDIYRERISKFFAFHDKNNCKRVYEELVKKG